MWRMTPRDYSTVHTPDNLMDYLILKYAASNVTFRSLQSGGLVTRHLPGEELYPPIRCDIRAGRPGVQGCEDA